MKRVFDWPSPPPPSRNRPQEGGFSLSGGSTPVPPASGHFAEIAQRFAAMPVSAAPRQKPFKIQNAGICPAYRSSPCLN